MGRRVSFLSIPHPLGMTWHKPDSAGLGTVDLGRTHSSICGQLMAQLEAGWAQGPPCQQPMAGSCVCPSAEEASPGLLTKWFNSKNSVPELVKHLLDSQSAADPLSKAGGEGSTNTKADGGLCLCMGGAARPCCWGVGLGVLDSLVFLRVVLQSQLWQLSYACCNLQCLSQSGSPLQLLRQSFTRAPPCWHPQCTSSS